MVTVLVFGLWLRLGLRLGLGLRLRLGFGLGREIKGPKILDAARKILQIQIHEFENHAW